MMGIKRAIGLTGISVFFALLGIIIINDLTSPVIHDAFNYR